MEHWKTFAPASDLPSGSAKEYVIDGRLIAVYHIEGRLYGIDGVCPHNGGPLAEGKVVSGILTCPWHGWQFQLETGVHCINPRIKHPVFPIRQLEGDLQISLGTSS